MAIKISQVAKDLNVGVPTLVEFLQKNNQNVEANNLNMRLTDEQYDMLINAFKKDKDLKTKSDRYFSERLKEKEKAKPAPEPRKEEIKRQPGNHLPIPIGFPLNRYVYLLHRLSPPYKKDPSISSRFAGSSEGKIKPTP